MKRTLSLILMLTMLASLVAALPLTAQAEADEAWFPTEIVDPTCTEQGYTIEYNMFYDQTRKVNFKPALGHDWGEWSTLSKPDCTNPGQKVRYCRRCQARDVASIPAIGHKWDSGTITKQPTCTQPGEKTIHCTNKFDTHVCTATKKESVPALGHNWGAWKEFLPGTCVQKQVLIRECSRCKETEMWTKDYGDHDWGEWQTVKEPTATEDGLRERVCKNDKSHVEQEVIPATGAPAPEEKHPALKTEIISITPDKEVYDPDDTFTVKLRVTNTGDVPLWPQRWSDKGNIGLGYWTLSLVLDPGKSYTYETDYGGYPAKQYMTPGTGTAELLGLVEFEIWHNGLDPEENGGNTWDHAFEGTALVESNHVGFTLKVAKPTEGTATIGVNAIDANNDYMIEGAHIQLLDGGSVIDEWESSHNTHYISGLTPGSYTLQETVAPEGYLPAATILFTVDSDLHVTTAGKTAADPSGVTIFQMGHNLTEVSILKVDKEDGFGVFGAEIQVLNAELMVVDEWTSTDSAHTIFGLKTGEQYTLREAKAPEGYDVAPDIAFTIDEKNNITTTGTLKGRTILIEDEKSDESLLGLYLEITWDPQAGKGKRVVGETVPVSCKVTNTSDIPVYKEYMLMYNETVADLVYPNGKAYQSEMDGVCALINPGESWTYTWNIPVQQEMVDEGRMEFPYKEKAEYSPEPMHLNYVVSNEVWIDIPLTDDDGPHPALLLEDTWAANAGEGKRYEGATVPIYCKMTNTGDCTVYRLHDYYSDLVTDIVYPNGETYVPELGEVAAAIQPGESWTLTYNQKVSASAVEKGFLEFNDSDHAWYFDANNDLGYVNSNDFPVHIDLTYPDGTTEEEPKPAIKLAVTQTSPEKEAYTNTYDCIVDNLIYDNLTVTNTGNVPLRFSVFLYRGAGFSDEFNTRWKKDFILNPGESWNKSDYWYYVCNRPEFFVPDPEDSPYAGNFPVRFKVFGYTVDDTERTTPICGSNVVDFNHKFAKPGPTPWPIPEESKLEVKVSTMDAPADPAGYQLGEDWGASVKFYNAAPVEAIDPNLHIDFTATDTEYNTIWSKTNGPTWVEYQKWPIFNPTTVVTLPFYGVITEEDVQRGYVEVSGYVTWTDPDSGKEKTAYSNVWNIPVISKTGLLLQKKASDPGNGSYFVPGEKVDWTLTVTNNSMEPIKNVTVTDGGIVVAFFAEIAAGETKNCPVPSTIVTDYDAQVTGYVSNVAKATGTDAKDATHTWYSNVAKADCGDDTPPILGANPGLSAVKKDKGPKNGGYYEEGEEITFEVTVTNTGDCELKDLTFYDSLAGFTPVDTLASLPVGAPHTFTYKYTVKPSDMNHPTLTNGATITYTFLGMPGTPATCSCTVKIGEGDTDTEDPDPPFDPGILKGDGEDYCKLQIKYLMLDEAHYTLHACDEHSAVAAQAETADAATACAIWQAEIDKLYDKLYAAANTEAKAVLLAEKAQFDTYAANLGASNGDEALAELLRFKCATLCCMIHTASDTLPSSLTKAFSGKLNGTEHDVTMREIGALEGSDSDVIELYAGTAARAYEGTLDLLHEAKTYDRNDVFLRAQAFWQAALDEKVNATYAAADRDQRKLIALWRTSLDALLTAERPLLELLYPDNAAQTEEALMDLFKEAGVGK